MLRREMKKTILVAAAVAMIPAAITLTTIRAQQSKKEIVRVTPEQVRWFTPDYYRTGGSGRSCSATQAKAARGSIGLRYLAASVSLHIHIRRTNWSQ